MEIRLYIFCSGHKFYGMKVILHIVIKGFDPAVVFLLHEKMLVLGMKLLPGPFIFLLIAVCLRIIFGIQQNGHGRKAEKHHQKIDQEPVISRHNRGGTLQVVIQNQVGDKTGRRRKKAEHHLMEGKHSVSMYLNEKALD